MSTSSANANLVLIGDNPVFDKFFLSFPTLNFGISGDKIQNVLWLVCYMTLPAQWNISFFTVARITLANTNSPLKIAERLININ